MSKTQAEIMQILSNDTHALWAKPFVDDVNEAFGTRLECHRYENEGGKGLTTNDGSPYAEGLPSFYIAPGICNHLGVKYESMMGRGFQVRACITALHNAGYPKDGSKL